RASGTSSRSPAELRPITCRCSRSATRWASRSRRESGRRTGCGSRSGVQPDQPLAEIFAAIETRDRVRTGLDAVEDVLAVGEAALANPGGKLRHRLLVAVRIIEHKKARHLGALDQQMPLDARAGRR